MAVTFTSEVTVSESGFLFDHATGQTFTLNATGRFILLKLQAGEENETILPELMAEFDVGEGTARRDLDDFRRQLRELGVIE